MTISIQYAYDDFEILRRPGFRWRLFFGRSASILIRLSLACVITTFGVTYLVLTDSWIWASCFILPAIPVALLLVATLHGGSHPFGSPEKWNKDPLSQGVVSLETGDAGLTLASPGTRTFYPWCVVTGLAEYPGAVIVNTSHQVFLLIPKRAFADDAQFRQFQTLVDSHAQRPHA